MKRSLGLLSLCGWIAIASLAVAGRAQTVSVNHYRFLPRLSVLNESGGIGGFDVDFRVMGKFDFTVELGPTDVWPPQNVAKFSNVDAWASHPILAYVLPLDQTLNLSGLTGWQLPVAAPFDVYQFDGTTQDGSSVKLIAAEIGPWLHLRGETTPPPGSADYFEYELKAVARRRPFADFTQDDAVDNADLAKWSSRFGLKTTALDGLDQGDANEDGVADGADFLEWQRQAGEVAPTLASLDAMVSAALATVDTTVTASLAAVPEPSSVGLLATGLGFLLLRRRQ
jgi:hypothetical protein